MPKNDQIWPKIGIFGQFGSGHAGLFGALLVGRLVVVARAARAVSRKTPIYFIEEMETIKIQLKARISTYHETGITPEPSVRAPIKWT